MKLHGDGSLMKPEPDFAEEELLHGDVELHLLPSERHPPRPASPWARPPAADVNCWLPGTTIWGQSGATPPC